MNIKKFITILYSFTIVGMFLPWFGLKGLPVYASEFDYILSPLTVWIIISGILLFLPGNSKGQMICTFGFLSLIPLTCVYYFLSWHMLLISGEATAMHNFFSSYYGFHLTLISSLVLIITYSFNVLKNYFKK